MPGRVYSRFCASISITKVSRVLLAGSYQGSRTLNAVSGLLLLRQTEKQKLNRRKKAFAWGMRYGIARAIENLRRVRMPLVQSRSSRDGLLQSM
jgi:hypothetical protein